MIFFITDILDLLTKNKRSMNQQTDYTNTTMHQSHIP